jgi:hypothetical protein
VSDHDSNPPAAVRADSRQVPARRVPVAARLVFLVAIVFTTIGLIECAFIGYDALTGSLAPLRAPDLGLGIRSWTEHHAMRPGYDEPPVKTNSFGLRSPEVAVPKTAGTFRVLLLGDSFTFGFKSSEDAVFARKLEALLRASYHLPSAEVVNAGVISYCPLLEYLQYRNHLHVLEPDVVVLNFDMSDVQDQLEYSRSTVWAGDGTPLYVTEPSLERVPSRIPDLLFFQWVGRKVTAVRNRFESAVEDVPFTRDVDRYLWALDDGRDMDAEAQRTMAPIADLARLLEHNHIPLLLATYPQPWQVSADATPDPAIRNQYRIGVHTVHLNDRPFRKLATFSAAHQIPFFNATAAFREAADPAGLFLQTDFHFSPRGNALYAELLAKELAGRGLLKPVQPAGPAK